MTYEARSVYTVYVGPRTGPEQIRLYVLMSRGKADKITARKYRAWRRQVGRSGRQWKREARIY